MFRLSAFFCFLFILLNVIAMFCYPGGIVGDPSRQGYAFFENFFSDLGQTRTLSGRSNLVSMVLFVIALCGQGAGIVLFFVGFGEYFTDTVLIRWLSRGGTALGIGSAICFVGVAATPWNLLLELHNLFVLWAFGLLLGAVLLYLPPMGLKRGIPRRFGWTFGGFAIVLFAYVLLLHFGPSPKTPQGLMVQVTGQKIIAFASVLTFLIQSVSALRLLQKSS